MKKLITLLVLTFVISISCFAQKGYSDCRTSISSASWSGGLYTIVFTNVSTQSTTYSFVFPNGEHTGPSVSVPPGQPFYYYHMGSYVAGNVTVCPDNVTVVNPPGCTFGCVYRTVTH